MTSGAFEKFFNLVTFPDLKHIAMFIDESQDGFGDYVKLLFKRSTSSAGESGRLEVAWDALDHRNVATTRVYVQRIAVKKDRYSAHVVRRLRNS